MVTEAVYDGFRKVGEIHRCPACGHTRQAGGTKPAARQNPKGDALWERFASDDKAEALNLFDVAAETGKLCRKCRHYVVHPFTQRCMLHDMEVAATDSCPQFEAKASEDGG